MYITVDDNDEPEVQIDFPAASFLALSDGALMGLAALFHFSPELEALPTAASTAISSSGTRFSSSTDIATKIFILHQFSGNAHWTKWKNTDHMNSHAPNCSTTEHIQYTLRIHNPWRPFHFSFCLYDGVVQTLYFSELHTPVTITEKSHSSGRSLYSWGSGACSFGAVLPRFSTR